MTFRRAHFAPSVLGGDWRTRIAALPEERRRQLLWDIAGSGRQNGIDFTVQALKQEPSVQVALYREFLFFSTEPSAEGVGHVVEPATTSEILP
jgi:hypothetical protein